MRTLLSAIAVSLALTCVSCTYPSPYMGGGIQAGYMRGPMGAIGGYRYMGAGYPMYGGGMYGGGMGSGMYGGGMYGGGIEGGMYGGGMDGGGHGGGRYVSGVGG